MYEVNDHRLVIHNGDIENEDKLQLSIIAVPYCICNGVSIKNTITEPIFDSTYESTKEYLVEFVKRFEDKNFLNPYTNLLGFLSGGFAEDHIDDIKLFCFMLSMSNCSDKPKRNFLEEFYRFIITVDVNTVDQYNYDFCRRKLITYCLSIMDTNTSDQEVYDKYRFMMNQLLV